MELVVDTNIAFSLLKIGSFSKKLMRKHKLELHSHPYVLDELDEHESELLSLLNVSPDKLERIKEILSKLIDLRHKVSPQQLNWAKSLISDPDDAVYLALALRLGMNIWSNDPHLKEQSVVKVFNTKELKDFLEAE